MRKRVPQIAGSFLLAAASLRPAIASARAAVLDFDGCNASVDQDEVARLLRIELASDGPATDVALAGSSTANDAIRIWIRCSGDGPDAAITIDTHAAWSLSFADTPLHLRPRTLALALAERVRSARLEPPPPAPPPAPVAVITSSPAFSPVVVVTPAPPHETERMRLAGQWALGLAVPAVVGLAVGSPITAVGDASANRGDLRGAGATILGISVAPIIGSAIAFGYWLHDKLELDRQQRAYEKSVAKVEAPSR